MIPPSLQRLIAVFQRIPEIGPRQAARMAFWVLKDKERLAELAGAAEAGKGLSLCRMCFFPADGDLCTVCANGKRDSAFLMVLIKETEAITVENARTYSGHYFILGDFILPMKDNAGVTARIERLRAVIQERKVRGLRELIFAFPSVSEGDETMREVIAILGKDTDGLAMTRLARGLPRGSEVEFADPETIKDAIVNRK